MLTNGVIPALDAEEGDFPFQQDGTPVALASRCLSISERDANQDTVFDKCPRRSPDLPFLTFACEDTSSTVFVPPLLATLNDLKGRITGVVQSMTSDDLHRVKTELDYCMH